MKSRGFSQSYKIKDEPLPTDKRRKPWPDIKKYKMKCKTWAQFYCELIQMIRREFHRSYWSGIYSGSYSGNTKLYSKIANVKK